VLRRFKRALKLANATNTGTQSPKGVFRDSIGQLTVCSWKTIIYPVKDGDEQIKEGAQLRDRIAPAARWV
jgi:hypothetical protein